MGIQQTIENYKTQKKVFMETLSAEFCKELAEMAKTVPGLVGIRWKQYTPYFNDGDACEFGVHEPEFKFEDKPEFGYDEDGYGHIWDFQYAQNKDNARSVVLPGHEMLETISKLIQDSDLADVFEDTYGDHVQVTFDVTSAAAVTEEYSHD